MNYEAERAMNQKRLRMESEPGHGVVQGNGLPLNYIDNGHQIPYQPYAGAYNTHYPPPDAFAAYGPPPPGGYAPQNLSYAPPAHQNYPHHQSFPPQQPPQAQLHMAQSHMVQGYGGVAHKAAWPPQPHLLAPLDTQKPLDVKQLAPEIKLEPTDAMKRPHAEEMMGGDLDQPKIKIKTDIFKPDDLAHRPEDKPRDVSQKPEGPTQAEPQNKEEGQPVIAEIPGEKQTVLKPEGSAEGAIEARPAGEPTATPEKSQEDKKPFSSPELPKPGTTPSKVTPPGSEPKKRGRPKGSTNKPKQAGMAPPKLTPPAPGAVQPLRGSAPRPAAPVGRPRATGYQYQVRPFRKDFSGIQFRRRWSDDCLDSSHIPNEVYFGDVPVPLAVLYNYYDANAERERLAHQAAHIAAQKAAAAKLAQAKLQARGLLTTEKLAVDKAAAVNLAKAKLEARGLLINQVTTVDSSSSDDSDSDGSDSDDSDEDTPLKKTPVRAKGVKPAKSPGSGGGKRGRPPVPPELREPGITDMKKFCKAAGIRFDYKKLTEGCTKNKERVGKMMELLVQAGLEGKPTMEKCKALKQAKMDKKEQAKQAKKESKVKVKEEDGERAPGEGAGAGAGAGVERRMTRGATGVKPRQRIVISSDEEDDTPAARRTLSKLRSSLHDESDSE